MKKFATKNLKKCPAHCANAVQTKLALGFAAFHISAPLHIPTWSHEGTHICAPLCARHDDWRYKGSWLKSPHEPTGSIVRIWRHMLNCIIWITNLNFSILWLILFWMLDLFLVTGPSLQSFDYVRYMAWKSRNLAQSAIYLDLICYLDRCLGFQPCKEYLFQFQSYWYTKSLSWTVRTKTSAEQIGWAKRYFAKNNGR